MPEFNALDRCDGCSAQAKHIAQKVGFGSLLFCGHHYRTNKYALVSDGWSIEHESDEHS